KDTKMTTSLSGKHATYKTTKLNYNNSENPQPDYYKKMPSNFYDVWNEDDTYNRTDENFETWERTRDFFTSSEANRQINWDRLYAANESANRTGVDAMYYVQARHNDQMKLTLASAIEHRLSATKKINAGFNAALSKGMHYYTMEDMLGANQFH
ncbi:MAG: TonB-dependent receptor, partial [Prevotellaceae bacterium]|nr:TonB-dependent receptor [Prevotellaceae bacterium]